jgi:predicted metalloprotease with PDZ domain
MRILRIEILKVLKICLLITLNVLTSCIGKPENGLNPLLQFSIGMPEPANHLFHVILDCKGLNVDTIDFKMPQWMPGYYQIMEYSREVKNFSARSIKGKAIQVIEANKNTWRVIPGENTSFSISYDVFSDKKFVACNYLDTTYGYIVSAATFMYINGHIRTPVRLKVIPFNTWHKTATGLDRIEGKINEFTAPDFDVLYDCPILVGNLDELPPFTINGIEHRFIALNPGSFNRELFISALEKAVKKGTELIGDIPYRQYTFIGIGSGYGGIEHLNNTTISFTGRGLEEPGAMSRMLKFISHEYFHNYNVKRIRPYELGPFDYDKENRTNLLWVSEGLTVYYEYLIVRRAGLINDDELFSSFEKSINSFENDPGRLYQSLSQASYNTWSDGPFGNKPGSQDKSISYYDKGPIIGLILDFAIRNATDNKKSLDDVMRYLYWHYYKTLDRGFTDAEFQNACELMAGISLSREFEYVYTTKELDYSKYLSFAGLNISKETDKNKDIKKYKLIRQENPNPLQLSTFKAWSGN